MKTKNNSIFYRGWMKALGVVALCILGALLVWCGSSLIFKEWYFPHETAKEYEETDHCEQMMLQDAENAVWVIANYGKAGFSQYNYGNLRLAVRNITDNVSVIDAPDENYSRKEQYYIAVDEYGYVYEMPSASLAEETGTVYQVDAKLLEGLPYEDVYRNMAEVYTFSGQFSQSALVICISLLLMFIVVLLYEFTVTGHVAGKEGITLYMEDKIPFDLLTGMYFVGGLMAALITGTAMPSASLQVQMIWMIVILMGVALLFYAWLMSAARRIKAGGWYRNTLIYKAGELVVSVCRMIPTVPAVAVISVVWLLFEWALCGMVYIDSAISVFMVFISPFMAAGAIHCAWFYNKMKEASAHLVDGDLSFAFSMKDKKRMIGPFRKYAENYEKISEGMQRAIDERMKSERLKAELITNVSHDIKTPLTSIINYVDLLQKEHTEEEEKEYIAVLDRQSQRLKKLTEDVVEASKASTGNITVNMMKTDVKEIIDQALAEYEDKIADAGLTVVPTVKDIPLYAYSDGRLLWRVLRNLLSNCAKYGLSGTRVYIDAYKKDAEHVEVIIKNTSRDELNISADELMERFVRGDASRHTEGSGLGLNIARSLMELMGGVFDIEIDGDLFKAIVILPVNKES